MTPEPLYLAEEDYRELEKRHVRFNELDPVNGRRYGNYKIYSLDRPTFFDRDQINTLVDRINDKIYALSLNLQ